MIQTGDFARLATSLRFVEVNTWTYRSRMLVMFASTASQHGCSLGLGFSASAIRAMPIDSSNRNLMLKPKKAVWAVSSCLVEIPIRFN